jgi:hypothetical protein
MKSGCHAIVAAAAVVVLVVIEVVVTVAVVVIVVVAVVGLVVVVVVIAVYINFSAKWKEANIITIPKISNVSKFSAKFASNYIPPNCEF